MPAAPPAAAPPSNPAAPAGVAPPSGGEIHVTAPTSLNEGNPTIAPPKPGSARAKMSSDLRKKAGLPDEAPVTPPAKPATPPETPAKEEPETPPAAPDPKAATPPAVPATADSKDGKKVNPWPLVNEYKALLAKSQAEVLELKKQVVPEATRKEQEERYSKAEARMKEMQDDLRFYNAEKYDPDIIKAESDYKKAWQTAISDLSEIQVIDAGTNAPRPLKADDILAIVNLPLGQARELANAAFGDFADDVMAHRKEIRNLLQKKTDLMEELKKSGGEREKARSDQIKKLRDDIEGQIKGFWDKEVSDVQANERYGKFFKPREGDEDWNKKLEKGYKFVESVYSQNAQDPRLSPQDRQLIVKRHVALRNRAAAFEAMRFDNERANKRIAELEKDLAAYKGSTPGNGGTTPTANNTVPIKAKDAMMAELRKLAK